MHLDAQMIQKRPGNCCVSALPHAQLRWCKSYDDAAVLSQRAELIAAASRPAEGSMQIIGPDGNAVTVGGRLVIGRGTGINDIASSREQFSIQPDPVKRSGLLLINLGRNGELERPVVFVCPSRS